MLPPHEEKANEAAQKARAETNRIAAAFYEVFGQGNRRTASQRTVLDHLFKDANDDRNAFHFDTGKDGMALALAAAHRDGAASRKRIIDRNLKIASESKEPAKPAPKVKR